MSLQSLTNKTKRPFAGKALLLLAFIATAMVWTGCEKDYNYVAPPVSKTPPVVTKTIHLSTDVQPIFSTKCAVSGCHDGMNYDPDLTTGNARTNLFNMMDIDTTNGGANAATSILYDRITRTAGLSGFMPKNGSALSADEKSNILGWIQQGALDN